MGGLQEDRHVVAQWIVSLAISIICCAVLFVVFGIYVVDLHRETSMAKVRLDVLQDRQTQILAELDAIRRPIPVLQINSSPTASQQGVPGMVQIPAPVPAVETPAAKQP